MKNLKVLGTEEIQKIYGGRPPSTLDSLGATVFVHAVVDFVSGAYDRFNLFRNT